ncbi:DUF115 domain-containing protein [Thermogymnomonas acidicola]|uniref:6-hydroxymethylpterin diphosphokinase MptE-like protein n=1 Tax=Thermogymnomonas acidicola TaxID=399579 RepID=UPI00094633FB|nr:6-hydroxymethylpterin diphosphokinase MptE-like protein [Thermogymnomonas acidicola]
MDWNSWSRYYMAITGGELGIDPAMDLVSSLRLSDIIGERGGCLRLSDHRLSGLRGGGDVYVIGNGPGLAELLHSVGEGKVFVADSAIGTFHSIMGGCPDFIVTDLDGDTDGIMECARKGSIVFVHAHGDNVEKVERLAPFLFPGAVGTTQNRPVGFVHNFYGFTDGDRAAFIAAAFGARRITLVGFDFEHPVHKGNPERKKAKLKWARALLSASPRSGGRRTYRRRFH